MTLSGRWWGGLWWVQYCTQQMSPNIYLWGCLNPLWVRNHIMIVATTLPRLFCTSKEAVQVWSVWIFHNVMLSSHFLQKLKGPLRISHKYISIPSTFGQTFPLETSSFTSLLSAQAPSMMKLSIGPSPPRMAVSRGSLDSAGRCQSRWRPYHRRLHVIHRGWP